MKQRTHLLIPLLAISMLALPVCKGTVVFSDTFSQTPGTPVVGSTADVGGTWTGTGPNISAANTYDTSSGGYTAFDTFTSALGPGKILTLDYDTLVPAAGAGTVFTGWSGVSLFSGGTEEIFTGNSALGAWGTDGANTFWIDRFHQETDGDSNVVNHIHFTYNYGTGAITFSTANGGYSGIEQAGVALDHLRIGNGGGAQFAIDNLTVDISAVPVVTFAAVSPANGSYSGSRTSVSLQAIDGSGNPVNTNTIVMKVDGGTVTPVITKSANVNTINYVPGSPLSAATLHTAQVTLADSNGALYTNAWSFTTAYQSLPSVLPGPIVASNQNAGIVIFSTNDAWMGANYGSSSGRTIYTRFSLEFDNLNGETGNGGGYGGLQFILGGISGAQHVLAGNAWMSTNWSADVGGGQQVDFVPATNIVFGEWHTIVERVDLTPGGNATVNLWLDPDFTQPEVNQPTAPLTYSVPDTFDTIVLRTGNGTTSATFSNIVMSALSPFPPGGPATFLNLVPAANNPAAALATPIGAQVVFGTYGIGTNTVALTLDSNPVTPSFTVTSSSITVNYQPPTPFVANSSHTVGLSVTDSNGTPYSTSWAFTVDPYPSLPVTIPGPINVVFGVNGALGIQLFTSENEWIGGNYQSTSTNTLYTQFSMAFGDLNGETADDQGGCYGGLHFYEGTTERLLTGETWLRNTWSIDDKTGGEGGELNIPPVTTVVTFEWHTMVVKSVYSATGNATETVWLDPDFTKSEGNQPNSPLVVSMNNTFDNIRLRCGNGSAYAQFTNIVIAATSPFVVPPGVLSLQKSGGNVTLSWTGGGTLLTAPAVTGPWTTNSVQTNPQIVVTTNSARFFRLRQ
jgi:hypothetical protein